MKTNVRFFRGNVVSPVLEASRATNVAQISRIDRGLTASCAPPRSTLLMTWHIHPATGRLECHWMTDGGTATDEGVSCSRFVRQAA
jgi:hypothetical protein